MALQPFVGPWPLFSFLIILQSRQDHLGGGSARRKATTYTQDSINPDMHASSGIRTHDPSVRAGEESSCLRRRDYCDRLASEQAKTVHALDGANTVTG
jgi:hypothetical protein